MPSIISGKRRGASLRVPEGLALRPSLQRVREAIFSSLQSQLGSFEGLSVFDPFAGSGAYGLEAWSRGAAWVDFVEKEPKHAKYLRENIEKLGANASCRLVVGQTPEAWKALDKRRYHLVFLDPPYANDNLSDLLYTLAQDKRLAEGALLLLESASTSHLEHPECFECLRERCYASTRTQILRFFSSDVS